MIVRGRQETSNDKIRVVRQHRNLIAEIPTFILRVVIFNIIFFQYRKYYKQNLLLQKSILRDNNIEYNLIQLILFLNTLLK